jgi:hypothetical protein
VYLSKVWLKLESGHEVWVGSRVLFSGCKIRRENLWLVVGCKYTNQRFSLRILQPEKTTLVGRDRDKYIIR